MALLPDGRGDAYAEASLTASGFNFNSGGSIATALQNWLFLLLVTSPFAAIALQHLL